MQHFWSGSPLLSMLCVIISCDTLGLKKMHKACSLHVMLLYQPILQLVLVLALWHTQRVTHLSNSPQWHSDTCDKANRNPPFSVAGVRLWTDAKKRQGHSWVFLRCWLAGTCTSSCTIVTAAGHASTLLSEDGIVQSLSWIRRSRIFWSRAFPEISYTILLTSSWGRLPRLGLLI